MILDPEYVVFTIPELTKTSKPGSPMQEVRFDCYPVDPSLCVVCYLRVYLERTLKARWIDTYVFITYGKVGERQTRASRDTISRWIMDMLKSSGIDTKKYSSHSTRSSSTSGAVDCFSLAAIMKAAGWRKGSTFQRFYKRPIEKSGEFQKGLLDKNQNRPK